MRPLLDVMLTWRDGLTLDIVIVRVSKSRVRFSARLLYKNQGKCQMIYYSTVGAIGAIGAVSESGELLGAASRAGMPGVDSTAVAGVFIASASVAGVMVIEPVVLTSFGGSLISIEPLTEVETGLTVDAGATGVVSWVLQAAKVKAAIATGTKVSFFICVLKVKD